MNSRLTRSVGQNVLSLHIYMCVHSGVEQLVCLSAVCRLSNETMQCTGAKHDNVTKVTGSSFPAPNTEDDPR